MTFDPASIPDSGLTVSDAEVRAYYDTHKKELERPGRAIVSAADSAASVSIAVPPGFLFNLRDL